MILECTGFAFLMVNVTCREVAAAPPAAVCPPVRAWSAEFQKQVAREIRAAPGSALSRVATEAIGMRDVARACAKARRQ
jgi:hypothetical protein